MGNCTSITTTPNNTDLVTAVLANKAEQSLVVDKIENTKQHLVLDKSDNLKTSDKTIIYLNPNFVAWSIGYIVKIENDDFYVLDKYTSKLLIFKINSAALLWNNEKINKLEPHIHNDKLSNNLCLLGDGNKTKNNGKSYVSFNHHSGRSNKFVNSSNDIKPLFSNVKYRFYDQDIIYPELYLGNKVSVPFFQFKNKTGCECMWMNGIITSITSKNICLLMKNRDQIESVKIDKKYINHFQKYDSSIGHRLLSSVKYKINTDYEYGVIIDIIGNKAKLTNYDNLVNLDMCELVDITLEECKKYLDGTTKPASTYNFVT